MSKSVRQQIQDIVEQYLEWASVPVTDDSWLSRKPEDLNIDSLDMVEIVMEIEDRINQRFEIDLNVILDYSQNNTFSHIIDKLEQVLNS